MEKASVGIGMNFIEISIGEKLKQADPELDVTGSDHSVLEVACRDFINYLKVHWNLVGKEANQCDIIEKLETLLREDPKELDEFLAVWCNLWFNKWKQRVKLLLGNQGVNQWNQMAKAISEAEPFWRRIEQKQELQEIVIATLIRNGEVCGTEILAENLLKIELGDKRVQYLKDRERIFVALNNTLRKAREMAHSRGPLIFVKIDKGYYNTTLE